MDGKTRPDCWYRVGIETRGSNLKVFLDDKLLLESANAKSLHGCVGVGTLNTSARFRNPRISAPNGKPLMNRWPADLLKANQTPSKTTGVSIYLGDCHAAARRGRDQKPSHMGPPLRY